MKLNYYPETDSLYIDLSTKTSVDSREISEGIVLDYDSNGNLVGIDIDNASKKIDLTELVMTKMPVEKQRISA
ncbi:MAG: DUF2283 domain-containing protein [Candidatus Marinimicrobia bacterium]|nr:DUF2283 domain-containing protein [Candidatus Neomarinimicrobiota bacterium]